MFTDDIKILWISSLATMEKENEIICKGYKPAAASIVQWYYINEIEKDYKTNIDIISGLIFPDFPNYKELFFKKEFFSHNGKSKDVYVGFINLKYINHLIRNIALKKAVKDWLKHNKDKKIIIIQYALNSGFLAALRYIKRHSKSCVSTVIIPDLPKFTNLSSGRIKRVLKKIDGYRIDKNLKYIDKYVFYTKQMSDYYKVSNEKYIVIEGLINENKISIPILKEKMICLYCGTLQKRFAIVKMIRAFINANVDNAELHIVGHGDALDEIVSITNENKNVKYFGVVDSEKAFEMMRASTILLNPRPTNDEYTIYSCPSKQLEYMASGTPVITTRLKGIPDEYFDYVYTFDDETEEGMCNTFKDVLNKSYRELYEKGLSAQNFILNNKTSKIQCTKLMKFINE